MVKKINSTLIIMIMTLILIFSFNVSNNVAALSFGVDFETSSKAIYLANLDTDTTVFEKNSQEKVYPASVTKIMTYIITIENVSKPDTTMVTVSDKLIDLLEGTDSSLSDIKRGETLSVTELLNCLMIPSGNDAAMVLADYVGSGSIENFVGLMNEKAIELGCKNTHFKNPTGLHDIDHYTTASDLYKIAKYAMTKPKFMEITTQIEHTIPKTNKQPERTLTTTNKMMIPNYTEYYYQYTKGIKTGWHDEAGYCIVSSATADGYTYLCVAMGAPFQDANKHEIPNGAMIDSKNLYRWALTTFELKNVIDAEKPVDEVGLKFSWGKDTLLLLPEKDFNYLLPKDVKPSSVTITTIEKPDFVNAPIHKGDIIGKASVSYANQELGIINLVASEDESRSEILFFFESIKNIISSPIFIVLIIVFILLLIAYIITTTIYNKKNRYKRNIRKYRNL